MSILKLALSNITMWVRDNYFPPEYQHATWARLAPFFKLPGRVSMASGSVSVELRTSTTGR